VLTVEARKSDEEAAWRSEGLTRSLQARQQYCCWLAVSTLLKAQDPKVPH
jgi:hypothetical protein